MAYRTYALCFQKHCKKYRFKKPKTEVCDLCVASETKLAVDSDDPCKSDYILHSKKVKSYMSMKKEYIRNAKDSEELLVIEFYYAQNLPLPKLNVTSQFYKRLLWFYNFNIHVHNDNSSHMYTYLEGEAKKGAESVISFLYDFLSKKVQEMKHLKTIVFLSDACGGQKKNLLMTYFGLWFAKKSSVDILHLYPVRGHSFCQCDRNFGVYKNAIKKH